jgi:hypothetical protein
MPALSSEEEGKTLLAFLHIASQYLLPFSQLGEEEDLIQPASSQSQHQEQHGRQQAISIGLSFRIYERKKE